MLSAADGQSTSVSLFCQFLESAVHVLLYERHVYPPEIFERRRLYQRSVHIARHPQLVTYIGQIVNSLKGWILPTTSNKLAVVIFTPATEHPPLCMERFIFDLRIPSSSIELNHAAKTALEEHFAAALTKLSFINSLLTPNPPHCTFTLLLYTNQRYDTIKTNTSSSLSLSSSYSSLAPATSSSVSPFTWAPVTPPSAASSLSVSHGGVVSDQRHKGGHTSSAASKDSAGVPWLVELKSIRTPQLELEMYVEENRSKESSREH